MENRELFELDEGRLRLTEPTVTVLGAGRATEKEAEAHGILEKLRPLVRSILDGYDEMEEKRQASDFQRYMEGRDPEQFAVASGSSVVSVLKAMSGQPITYKTAKKLAEASGCELRSFKAHEPRGTPNRGKGSRHISFCPGRDRKERIDAMTRRMREQIGVVVPRSEVLRLLLDRGLDEFEKEYAKARPMELVEWLEQRGWSMARLCRAANVSPPTVRKAVQGEPISAHTARKVSSVTNGQVPVESLQRGAGASPC